MLLQNYFSLIDIQRWCRKLDMEKLNKTLDLTKTFNRLNHLIALEKHDITAVFMVAFIVGILSLATPIAVQTLVNTVAMGGVLQPLFIVAIMLFILLIFSGILQIAERYLIEFIQRRLWVRTAIEAGIKAQGLDIASQDNHDSIEVMNHFFEVPAMRSSVDFLLADGMISILRMTIGSLALLFYSPYYFIASLIMFIILWFIIRVLGRDAIDAAIDHSYPKYDLVAYLTSTVRNLRASKFAVDHEYGPQKIDELSNSYLDKRARYFDILIRQDIAGRLTYAFGITSMLSLGAWLVMQGDLNLGQFVAAELIIFGVLVAYVKIILILKSYYELVAGLNKLNAIQDLPEERGGNHDVPLGLPAFVDFNQVSFSFDHQDQVVKQLTFSLPSGSSNAIIGQTGSGKSTLVDLITGLRSPASGVVMINGVDLRDANMEALRAQVSSVKNIEIFESSILDNLRLGHKDITVDSLINVLRSLGLFKAVLQLKDGLETKLSITGLPLTNHQLRVLMVARAVIHKPVLVIVDELLDDLDEVELKPVLEYLFAGLNQWTLLILTKDQGIAGQCQHIIKLESRHEL